jgi:hypothetical protein
MARPVSYHQGKFPPVQIDWPRLISLIGPANAALAHYDGLLMAIKKGLLKTLRKSSGRRPAMFAFSELLDITEGRSVF